MAGRFVFQKFASGMWRSTTSRLGARMPASSSATALGARYLSTFPGPREAAKTGWSKTAMQDSVGGVKPTCSYGACDKPRLADWLARAKAWWARTEFQPELNIFLLFALVAVCTVPLSSEVKSRHKAAPRHCSGCCYCLNGRSEPQGSGVQVASENGRSEPQGSGVQVASD